MLKTNKQIKFISETPMAHSASIHLNLCVFGESESKMKSMSIQYRWAQKKSKRHETKRNEAKQKIKSALDNKMTL